MRITWGTYFFCLIKCKLWGINLALDLKSLEKRGVLVGGRRDGVEHEPEESKLDNYLVTLQSVQSLSHVQLFVTPWTAARQTSLSITNSWSLLKVMFIELVMPSNHLILCRPLLLLPSIFPSTRVLSNKSVVHIRWPKYWGFSFSISPSSEYSVLISFLLWLLQACSWLQPGLR